MRGGADSGQGQGRRRSRTERLRPLAPRRAPVAPARAPARARRPPRSASGTSSSVDGSLRHPYFRDLPRQLRARDDAVEPARASRRRAAGRTSSTSATSTPIPACQRFAARPARAPGAAGRRVSRSGSSSSTAPAGDPRPPPGRMPRRRDRSCAASTTARSGAIRGTASAICSIAPAHLGVPVLALDRATARRVRRARRRDEHAARRIAVVLAARPAAATDAGALRRVAPLARPHPAPGASASLAAGIERRDRSRCSRTPSPSTGRSSRAGGPLPAGGADRRAGPSPSSTRRPLARYEAYRQVLERWRGDTPPDEDVDLTPGGPPPDRHAPAAGWRSAPTGTGCVIERAGRRTCRTRIPRSTAAPTPSTSSPDPRGARPHADAEIARPTSSWRTATRSTTRARTRCS